MTDTTSINRITYINAFVALRGENTSPPRHSRFVQMERKDALNLVCGGGALLPWPS